MSPLTLTRMALGSVTATRSSASFRTGRSEARTATTEGLELGDDGVGLLLEPCDECGEELGAVEKVHGDTGAANTRSATRSFEWGDDDVPVIRADELAVGTVSNFRSVTLLRRKILESLDRRDLEPGEERE